MAKSLKFVTKLWVTWIAVILVLFINVAGCGPNAKQAALKDTLITLNSAQDGFIAWDNDKQTEIVNSAESFDDGNAKLNEYHKKRESVLIGFTIAYEALATATMNLNEANFLSALAKAEEIFKLVEKLTGKSFAGKGSQK